MRRRVRRARTLLSHALRVSLCLLLLPVLAVGQTNQYTGSLTTNGNCGVLSTIGRANATISLTGTWTGTVSFTAQIGSAAYDTLSVTPLGGGTAVTSATANGRWVVGGAFTNIRVCATAAMTGTAVANMLVSVAGSGPFSSAGASVTQGTTPWVVDGSAVTQPVSLASVPSHAVTNAGTFATQAAQSGTWTVQPGNTANTTAWKVDGSAVTQPVSVASLPALPANQSVNVAQIAGASPVLDPCQGNAKSYVNISQTTGTQLFAGTSAKKTYVCSINVVSATAQNIALVSGTGTVCATGTAGMSGGTTAATGWNLAANGGLAFGNGAAALMVSGANADNVCLLTSSTGQISGNLSYVAQ